MKRESWQSRFGFIFAAAGSAVGLANIWKFPYICEKYGGAAFLFVYLLSLLLIGIPVFIAEILIGRSTKLSPSGAFKKLWIEGRGAAEESSPRYLSLPGKWLIATGFIVSSFYSAVAGWILGYLVEAFKGNLSSFSDVSQAAELHSSLVATPLWGLFYHLVFLLFCSYILLGGVRGGIEQASKWMMPMLYCLLGALVIYALFLPRSGEALTFLFQPDWSALSPEAILAALGHSFFTLSLGQGTMITYGSYLKRKENILSTSLPVILMDTFVSVFGAMAIFMIAFSVGVEPGAGPGLIFQTLPMAFSQIYGGYILAILFFLLVAIAAITSEISAMEPLIAYLQGEKGISRRSAVIVTAGGAFVLGIPSVLSFSLMSRYTFYGATVFDAIDFFATNVMIPLGGFFAIILVGWILGARRSIEYLKEGAESLFNSYPWLNQYFFFCFKYSAPILIVLVFLHALGVFG